MYLIKWPLSCQVKNKEKQTKTILRRPCTIWLKTVSICLFIYVCVYLSLSVFSSSSPTSFSNYLTFILPTFQSHETKVHITIIFCLIPGIHFILFSAWKTPLFLKKYIFYLILEREEGRGKHQCVVALHVPPTGDLACNPGMCFDWELNQWPFGLQASTEPHYQEENSFKNSFQFSSPL